MRTKIVFENERCSLMLIPEGEWEQRLVGALAQGKEDLAGTVRYKSEGHLSNQRCAAITIELEALPDAGVQPDE